MRKTKQLAEYLKTKSLPVMHIYESLYPNEEDDMVTISDDIHIQVGDGYYSVVYAKSDEKYKIYPTRSDMIQILGDILIVLEKDRRSKA